MRLLFEGVLFSKFYGNVILQNFSYIQYSNVAARVVRQALKKELQADAGKRDITGIKFQKWEAGKPVGKYFWHL